MQLSPLLSASVQPAPDGYFGYTEHFLQSRGVYPQTQQPEDLLYLPRLAFQPVQDRIPSCREFLLTCLTFEIADLLVHPMAAISHKRVDLFLSDPIIFAGLVKTKIPRCAYLLLRPALPFPQLPGYRCFTLCFPSFSFVFPAEATIPLALWPQHRRLSRWFVFLLLL